MKPEQMSLAEQLAGIVDVVPKSPPEVRLDDVDLQEDVLVHKTPVGELRVKLNQEQSQQLVDNVFSYQKAVIGERQAAKWQTFGMAALTCLSALAVCFTMYQGVKASNVKKLPTPTHPPM